MRDKQIEEMAKIIDGYCEAECLDGCYSCVPYKNAEKLYNAGYRKASYVAREIFEEIDEITLRYLDNKEYSTGDMVYDLDKLKEKYESEDE